MVLTRFQEGEVSENRRRWAINDDGGFDGNLVIDAQEVVRSWEFAVDGGTLTLVHRGEDGESRFVEFYVKST